MTWMIWRYSHDFGNPHVQLRKKDPQGKNHKAVIFSQFTAVLDLIQSVSWLTSSGDRVCGCEESVIETVIGSVLPCYPLVNFHITMENNMFLVGTVNQL